MKHVLVLVFFLAGIGFANAQSCTPAAAKNCATACKAAKGTATTASASLIPTDATLAPACTPEKIAACKAVCTPEQIAACQAVCTPEQIAACLAGKSKKEIKECVKSCGSRSKSATAVAPTPSTEKHVDQAYHAVPSKS
jgi:hypothetical protein